ncbi:hypothetical protein ACLMJK_009617 [Lecanora helva]
MRAFDLLISISSRPPVTFPPASSFGPQQAAAQPKKRRTAPQDDPSTPIDRTSQARPFAAVNIPGESAPPQVAASAFPLTAEPPQKKRGRPNKEERERRVREAAERGEVYPPPKKTKTLKQSLSGDGGAMDIASSVNQESPAKKSKAKNTKMAAAVKDSTPEIPARISSLEGSSSIANQMRRKTYEAPQSVLPQTQNLADSPRDTVLSGIEEHIGVAAPDERQTPQSSSTSEQVTAPQGGPKPSSA